MAAQKSISSAKVYRDMSVMTERCFQLVDKFNKHYKPIVGDRILNQCLNTLSAIHLAYSIESDKKSHIENAIFYFEEMLIMLRMAHDWKLISHKQHMSLFEQVKSISEQLNNWRSKYAEFTDRAS